MTVAKGAEGFANQPEVPEPVKLSIKGQFPRNISGTIWRTGPGTFSIPTASNGVFEISHWFDGLAQNHRFDIQPASSEHSEPTVLYSSRNAAKKDEDWIKEHGTFDAQTFAQQDPCKRIFRRLFQIFVPAKYVSENVSVNITPDMPGLDLSTKSDGQPSKLVIKSDKNQLAIVDPETLEVDEIKTYTDILGIEGQSSGAHSCTDRKTGHFFNYLLQLGPTCSYKVFCIDAKGKGSVLATITDAPAAYLHSMMLTAKYAILSIWQADYSYNGIPILANRNLVDAFKKWDPSRTAIFNVVDRTVGGKGVVARLTAPSFFCFHHVNAYDEGNDVILDVIAYKDTTVCTTGLRLDRLRSKEGVQSLETPTYRRYRLPVGSKKGQAELLWSIDNSIELPVVNPAYYHQKHRYAYGIATTKEGRQDGLFIDSIAKVDCDTQKTTLWTTTGVPGEPLYVAREGAKAEDDGVLLTVVFDLHRGKSALVALDAHEMVEAGQSRDGLDHAVWLSWCFSCAQDDGLKRKVGVPPVGRTM